MTEAFDEKFGDWNVRISKARMVWFAIAQKADFLTDAANDPFAHYGAQQDYHFELANSLDEVRSALQYTIERRG